MNDSHLFLHCNRYFLDVYEFRHGFRVVDSQSHIMVMESREPITLSSRCFPVEQEEYQVAYPKGSHRQEAGPTISARCSGQGTLHPVIDNYQYPSTRILPDLSPIVQEPYILEGVENQSR